MVLTGSALEKLDPAPLYTVGISVYTNVDWNAEWVKVNRHGNLVLDLVETAFERLVGW